MPATLSMLGLYQINKNLFDDILLPAGIEGERETIKNILLLNSAELEVLYPDPDTMRAALGLYSHERINSWNKLYDTTVLKYNPIWNKDGTVTETEKINSGGTRSTRGHENGSTQSTGISETSQSTSNSNTNNHFVYGYNESTGAQDSRSEDSGTGSGKGKQTDSASGSHALDRSDSEDHADNSSRTTARTEQGNIGVTTTQAMIREERDVDEFSIIRYIVNDIIHAMCILVY